MKTQSIIALLFASTLSLSSLAADECSTTCTTEYDECKAVAESPTAKQACEDDLQECKSQCPIK